MKMWPILPLVLVLPSCIKPEPVETADYYVDNGTALTLQVAYTPTLNLTGPLLTDLVPPGTRVRILTVTMGSGGHTMPSNFFTAFTLSADDSLVYEGVRNSDWRRETSGGRLEHELVVE